MHNTLSIIIYLIKIRKQIIHYGRLCLFRRSLGRQIHRRQQPSSLAADGATTLHLGYRTCISLNSHLWHRRRNIPGIDY